LQKWSAKADLSNYFMAKKSNGGRWKWILIVAVIAAGAGGYVYFRHGHGDPLNFNTVAAARGELTKLVTATGTLNPVVNVTVGSQVSGRISKLNVDFNSPVTKGEVIAEIDPRPIRRRSSRAPPICPTRRQTWNCSRWRQDAAANCSRTG